MLDNLAVGIEVTLDYLGLTNDGDFKYYWLAIIYASMSSLPNSSKAWSLASITTLTP